MFDGGPSAIRKVIATMGWRERVRYAIVAACSFVAILHLVATVSPILPGASAARHLLFAAINLVFAVLVARHSSFARCAIVPLALQQTWSHGGDVVKSLGTQSLDVSSLLVVLFVWGTAWFLWTDRAGESVPSGSPAP